MTAKRFIDIATQRAIFVARKSGHRDMRHGCVAVAIRGPMKGQIVAEAYNQQCELLNRYEREIKELKGLQ